MNKVTDMTTCAGGTTPKVNGEVPLAGSGSTGIEYMLKLPGHSYQWKESYQSLDKINIKE